MIYNGKWEIGKEFNFEYGHRVWSQSLNPDYSLNTLCACRYPHGHSGRVIVSLTSEALNEQGMVTDFKHLNWFKKFLDDHLDHKFIMHDQDPMVPVVLEGVALPEHRISHPEGFWTLGGPLYDEAPIPAFHREWLDGIVLVPFIPTSENLSAWLYSIVKEKMRPLKVHVAGVQFFETIKSQSNYSF